jgi:hypothetical protein
VSITHGAPLDGGQFYAASESVADRERMHFCAARAGDHEIWQSPITMRRFMVDNFMKSRHWANFTLKQAGLPKAF